jgi:Flp pilus assembly protein TadG
MVEFAIVGPIFFALLFLAFDFAYESFSQAALDSALQATARQIQVGEAQGATSQSLLVSGYLCPNAIGLLNCNNLFVRVESFNDVACPGGTGVADVWDAIDGQLPIDKSRVLNLSLYGGVAGGGANAGPNSTCENSSSTSGFCVAGPQNGPPVLIILSAVYVAPSFLGRLLPGAVTYNGATVRADFSSSAFITEGFVSSFTPTKNGPSAC